MRITDATYWIAKVVVNLFIIAGIKHKSPFFWLLRLYRFSWLVMYRHFHSFESWIIYNGHYYSFCIYWFTYFPSSFVFLHLMLSCMVLLAHQVTCSGISMHRTCEPARTQRLAGLGEITCLDLRAHTSSNKKRSISQSSYPNWFLIPPLR